MVKRTTEAVVLLGLVRKVRELNEALRCTSLFYGMKYGEDGGEGSR
jgi:hypothetical protein